MQIQDDIEIQTFTYQNTAITLSDDEIQLSDIKQDANKIKSCEFTKLMKAAENGDEEAVNQFIEGGEDLDYEVEGQTAASLAFANGHHAIVLSLIKANSKYPKNFNIENTSDDLKAFVVLSLEMHEKINEENNENVEETKNYFEEKSQLFPSVRHFYDTNNNSLLKIAIVRKMFEIYKILIALNIFLGEDESVDDIVTQLAYNEQRKLRAINEELSTNIFTDEMMILMRNCKLGPGVTDHGFYIEFIRKAFDFLFTISSVEIILKVVAARREFKIIFDFKRTSVQFLDPSAEPYTNGLFYPLGKIYVAAKDMLDPSKAIDVYSVIAHELCHFAMFLVYENNGSPFLINELHIEEGFNEIARECHIQKDHHITFESVFNDYPKEMLNAELIVRVPQLIVLYYNDMKMLTQLRETFPKLFYFYESKNVSDMQVALPKLIKKFKAERQLEKQVKKMKYWIIFLVIILSLLIPFVIIVAYKFYPTDYTWSELSNEQRDQFKNATLKFHGFEIKFHELYANDSNVYNLLTSEHIKFGLEEQSEELSHTIDNFYKGEIFLTYSNMTEDLKRFFLTCKVNFQGEIVRFEDIVKNYTILNLLNTSQVHDTIFNKPIKISNPTEIKTKFFVDRDFIEEHHNENDFKENFDLYETKIYGSNINKLFEKINYTRVFILSDVAGEGKSTTFKYFSKKIKEIFPEFWVQYVDLKKHFNSYSINSDLKINTEEDLHKFLTQNLLVLNEFESAVFREIFTHNKTIFLWDGIDEIAPVYEEFMLDLTFNLRNNTGCFQFISTRPQFSQIFATKMMTKSYKFEKLSEQQQLEFSAKILASEHFNKNATEFWENIKNYLNLWTPFPTIETSEMPKKFLENNGELLIALNKSQTFLNSIQKTEKANPLLIQLAVENLNDKNFDENQRLNLYTIYDKFIDKKLEIVREEKGKIVGQDLDKIVKYSLNFMKAHQAYAILHIFQNKTKPIVDFTHLKVMEYMQMLSKNEISRYGLVNFYSDLEFAFSHRTFAEFFVAHYLIDELNIASKNPKPSDDSPFLIYLINQVLFTANYEVIKKFIFNYAGIKNDDPFFFLIEEQKSFSDMIQNSITKYSNVTVFYKTINGLNIYRFYKEMWEQILNDFLRNKMLKEIFFQPRRFGYTFLHEAIYEDKNLETYLIFCEKLLRKDELAKLVLTPESSKQETSLMDAVKYKDLNILKTFWNFLSRNFSAKSIKELLEKKDRNFMTALHYSTYNQDPKSFLFMKEVYESNFANEEIRSSFLNINQPFRFTFGEINLSSNDTYIVVGEFLNRLFENQKSELRKILSSRDENGSSILNFIEYNLYRNLYNVEDKYSFYKDRLRKTFKVNEEKEFNEFFKILHMNLDRFLSILMKFEKSEISQNIVHGKTVTTRSLDESTKINKIKNILLNKKNESLTVFHKMALHSEKFDDKFIQNLLNYTQNILSLNEIKTMIFAQAKDSNKTFLMFAARTSKLKTFWDLIKFNLDHDDKRALLQMKDKNSFTALHHSVWNQEKSLFNFMIGIYNIFFSKEEIRLMLLTFFENKVHFASEIIKFAYPDISSNIADYLFDLNRHKKHELRKFLSFRDLNGQTIYSAFKENSNKRIQKNLETFKALLAKTFDDDEENEFKNLLKELEIDTSVLPFDEEDPYDSTIIFDLIEPRK